MSSLSDPGDRQADPAVKLALALLRLEQALASGRAGVAGAENLSPLQSQILLDLLHDAGGDATAGHFARRYGVRPPTLSESLEVLVRKGLVRMQADRDDRRRRLLSLTARGRAAAQRAEAKLGVLVQLTAELAPVARATCLEAALHLIRRCQDLGWVATDRMCVTCEFFARDRAPGTAQPHYCRLVERPLGPADLRIDCPEHQPVVSSSNP